MTVTTYEILQIPKYYNVINENNSNIAVKLSNSEAEEENTLHIE